MRRTIWVLAVVVLPTGSACTGEDPEPPRWLDEVAGVWVDRESGGFAMILRLSPDHTASVGALVQEYRGLEWVWSPADPQAITLQARGPEAGSPTEWTVSSGPSPVKAQPSNRMELWIKGPGVDESRTLVRVAEDAVDRVERERQAQLVAAHRLLWE